MYCNTLHISSGRICFIDKQYSKAQCFKITQNVAFSIFQFLAFPTNFCPINSDLSGNTVWPSPIGFKELAKMVHIWQFLMNFCSLKM